MPGAGSMSGWYGRPVVGTRGTNKADIDIVSDIMPALTRASVNIGRTWFISTCVPAFNPEATQSSSVFSNRFFSRTTAFKKSVLSMCGACDKEKNWVDRQYTYTERPTAAQLRTISLSKNTCTILWIVSPICTSSKNCKSGATLVVPSCSAGL